MTLWGCIPVNKQLLNVFNIGDVEEIDCFFPELDSVLNLKMKSALCQLFQHYQSLSSFANAYNLSTTAFFHLSSAANLE